MVEVLVWNFMEHGNIGHAALKVGSDYISWWPAGTATIKHGRHPGAVNSESDDLASEGRSPDHRIRIRGLDEDAICRWWHTFRDGEEYRLFVQNCSTVVALALKAGGGTARTSGFGFLYHSWNVIWTPGDIRRYAEAIQGR
ncbi:MAG: hypothetical protein ABL977_12295 [Candidatus Eisenbacteria bacterium]